MQLPFRKENPQPSCSSNFFFFTFPHYRLQRSQSQNNVSKKASGSIRRSTSLRTLPSQEGKARANNNRKKQKTPDGSTTSRKGTPHPSRRSGSQNSKGKGNKSA